MSLDQTEQLVLKNFIFVAAGISETSIFLILGYEIVSIFNYVDWALVLCSTISSIIIRAVTSLACTVILRTAKLENLTWKSQILIAFGSLRGPISYALGYILKDEHRREIRHSNIASIFLISLFQGIMLVVLNWIVDFHGSDNKHSIKVDVETNQDTKKRYKSRRVRQEEEIRKQAAEKAKCHDEEKIPRVVAWMEKCKKMDRQYIEPFLTRKITV